MNVQRNAMRAKSGRAKALSSVAAIIQPHGLLFAIDAGTLGIKHVSANVADLLGLATENVIGTPISELVDEDYAKALAGFSAAAGRTAGPSGQITLRGSSEVLGWRAASHRSGNTITLEAAPVPVESPELDGFLFDATAALRAVRDHAGIEATATTVARRLREMTGYDRVLVLRFDAQDQGEVIAESKAPSAGSSLLGRHLLADEIPVPVRALVLQNPERMIHDLTAPPVPVVPDIDAAGETLDLSEAILRAAPQAQVQLLAGMGARAALIMSLVHVRRLWGMVIFLHRMPRRLSLPHRSTLQLMADAIAVRLATAENQESERELQRRRRALAALRTAFDREAGENVAGILRRHGRALLRIVGVSGAWCSLPEAEFGLGLAPLADTAWRIASLSRVRAPAGSLPPIMSRHSIPRLPMRRRRQPARSTSLFHARADRSCFCAGKCRFRPRRTNRRTAA